jgi:hypothetical protein
MSCVNLYRKPQGKSFAAFVREPGTQVAGAVLVADAAAMVLDNNGFIGFLLFGAGVVAAIYLLVGWFRGPVGQAAAFVRRPRGAPPGFVPPSAHVTAALALIPTAIGANLFKSGGDGVEDVLNLVSFLGFVSVVAFFAVLTVATAVAWVSQDTRR